ncbi:helicase and polymerase containing protein tebichi [Metarhizium rileyi]|uniref:Helicase and polymerase containing protein tebichi n=1 Tax=Metarhizium rileyi (strain RCEF 4871) TaxID=1649241 RepID=A0A167E2P5_METRR|nr:helicase and polymerase containing protein tebichi [Metarhizium rileyi RCEF 4871]
MKRMQGILHKTSIQTVHEQQKQSFVPPSVAGHKRPLSNDDSFVKPHQHGAAASATDSLSYPIPHFQKVTSLPLAPRQLSASKIIQLDGHHATTTEYSQRRLISATPLSSQDPELSLAHGTYGLPGRIVSNFASLGIKHIYPWQKNCLRGPGLMTGERNLVYCAPTGGGKSLVADLLMLKRILGESGTKALLVLPYVALVQEKVGWLRNVVQDVKILDGSMPEGAENGPWRRRADHGTIRVVGFFGGGKIRATWEDFDIGVCTLEKANALINTAINDGSVSKLRSVVLDELHIIDDDHRGYILELIATKLLCLGQQVQLIGMSATLPNLNLLAAWLKAHSYETRYRPVPIEEHLVYDGKVFLAGPNDGMGHTPSQFSSQEVVAGKTTPIRRINSSVYKEFTDSVLNAVVSLAHETACMGYGVLVFAGSRGMCESDARWISRVMPQLHELSADILDKRMDLLGDLRSLSTGVDPVLEETVLHGVAFHRDEERSLVAAAYDAGTILVCVATCSLAAGINLPAQLADKGKRRSGKRICVVDNQTWNTFWSLCMPRYQKFQAVLVLRIGAFNGEIHNYVRYVHVGLAANLKGRALLEVISIRLATCRESIFEYFSNSLLQMSQSPDFITNGIDSSIEELESMGLIVPDSTANYAPTQLGKAIVASAIDPDDGVFVHKELVKALRAFVMDGEMHILYVFTPVQEFGAPVNWQVFRNEMESLDESSLRVLQFLGIKPTSILRLAQGAILKETTLEEKQMARVYRRFYLAMQLRDLCNEVPIQAVARKYDMPRGSVQTLSQTCQGFAAGMVKFCEHMGWGPMAAALDHFSDRLMAGARAELLALSKVPFVKSRTARVFFENGYRSVAALANANPKDFAQPNKLRIKGQNDDLMEDKMLAKANVISSAANRLWNIQMQAEIEEE